MTDVSLRALASLQHLKVLTLVEGCNSFTLEGVLLLLRGRANHLMTHVRLWCIHKLDAAILQRELETVTRATGRLDHHRYPYCSVDFKNRHWILLMDLPEPSLADRID